MSVSGTSLAQLLHQDRDALEVIKADSGGAGSRASVWSGSTMHDGQLAEPVTVRFHYEW
jgi:hypothetical protein